MCAPNMPYDILCISCGPGRPGEDRELEADVLVHGQLAIRDRLT